MKLTILAVATLALVVILGLDALSPFDVRPVAAQTGADVAVSIRADRPGFPAIWTSTLA